MPQIASRTAQLILASLQNRTPLLPNNSKPYADNAPSPSSALSGLMKTALPGSLSLASGWMIDKQCHADALDGAV